MQYLILSAEFVNYTLFKIYFSKYNLSHIQKLVPERAFAPLLEGRNVFKEKFHYKIQCDRPSGGRDEPLISFGEKKPGAWSLGLDSEEEE